MNPGYDMYGRPIQQMPMQPQYNPYHQQPQVNYKSEMEMLYQKMKDMEARLYGGQGGQISPNQNNSPPNSGYSNQANSASQITLIPVSSADDAWTFQADWTGTKQYFINANANEIYIKHFDANIPDTIKQVYRLVENEKSEMDEMYAVQSSNDKDEIIAQIMSLESEIGEVKKLISNITVLTPVDNPEKPKTVGRPKSTKIVKEAK